MVEWYNVILACWGALLVGFIVGLAVPRSPIRELESWNEKGALNTWAVARFFGTVDPFVKVVPNMTVIEQSASLPVYVTTVESSLQPVVNMYTVRYGDRRIVVLGGPDNTDEAA